ncbi:mitochondrial fission ELM1 family protein [Sulfurovum sp. XGS-02]|uniref:ELM1/GtrOC1 family putative glycosyltransferase n=1 Tax=Sulfurovum sp. XGS-02 TaxID=2925411 RepID=UPI00204E019B|nr:ELM1/GtrOC1 family putative glycosyltransferase [Sulfurovum sp. XGS-02]UPT77178.1 mitochondrial fission ELM1 family protein [Sulfurovum sp. XGS-02]
MSRVLILSDDRPGHLNQSLALVKYLNVPYDVVSVRFKYKWVKALSYILDKIGMYTDKLFDLQIDRTYDMVVGTGSTTSYATKVFAKKMDARSVAMMLPRGYRYDFDIIFAQSHDNPPKQKNIIEIPANFAYVEPQGLYQAKKKSIGIVIGGDNKLFTMSKEKLQLQLDTIVDRYKEYEVAVTTSPRTSKEIEDLIASYAFDYEVTFSKNPINPIPDFLDQCETVFITGDSTSMISEAVSYGNSNVMVLPLESKRDNKFIRFIDVLEKEGYLHIFDGTIKNKNKKIDFKTYLTEVNI